MNNLAVKKKTKELYSDFSVNLTPHPETHFLVKLTNENSVMRGLKNLIFTNKFERPFQPNLAGNIRALLFENITPQTTESIKKSITNAIENYEPRVKLIRVDVTPDEAGNSYSVSIYFYVVGKTDPIHYPLTLYRVR